MLHRSGDIRTRLATPRHERESVKLFMRGNVCNYGRVGTVRLIWPEGMFQYWIFTHGDEDRNPQVSDILWLLSASANVASNNSALVTFSQAEGDLMRNVPSLHLTPSQTRVNPWQLQCPSANPQSSPVVLGLYETVQLVKQRAREALNNQRETARRALLHQQGEFLAATHLKEAAAGANSCPYLGKSALWQEITRHTIIIMCRCNFDS